MFTDSRSIDDRATAASFDTAYRKYAAASDSWFDGTPFSVDNRLAQCRRLMHIARTRVARQGAEAGPLTNLAALETDARALTALREDLLTGAFDREDTSPIAGVRIASPGDKHVNEMTDEERREWAQWCIDHHMNEPPRENHREANCGDDEEFAGGEHDDMKWTDEERNLDPAVRRRVLQKMEKWERERLEKESALSPQDRRFVTLEASKFLADNTDTNDARELATRAMHYAQKVTSTYDVAHSQAVTSAFVAKVAHGAGERNRYASRIKSAAQAEVPDRTDSLPPEALFF